MSIHHCVVSREQEFLQISYCPLQSWTLVSSSLVRRSARRIAPRPLDTPAEKKKLDKSQNDYNRGYEVMYGQMIEKDTKHDLKEGFLEVRPWTEPLA